MTALWTASSLMGENKLFLKEKEEAGPWWLPALCLHPSLCLDAQEQTRDYSSQKCDKAPAFGGLCNAPLRPLCCELTSSSSGRSPGSD